jgi:ribonuclease BN (tRNA processing enzyme)
MQQTGVAMTDISLVLVSHFHWDHVAELPALLNAVWLQREKVAGPITLAGPDGLSDWLNRIMADDREWLEELGLEVQELDEKPREFNALRVLSGRSFHTHNSLSFRLENIGGTALFYSGDMDYQESLLPFASAVDLAVVECSWPRLRQGEGHLDPRLASHFAARAGVRALLLTHFYQEFDSQALIAQVKAEFPGLVLIAEDLQVYPIPR